MKAYRTLSVVQVNAFTDQRYGGNPALVVLGADHVEDDTLLKIANEMNVRETVFVLKSDVANHKFRYFTPRREIDFSGHATIAAFHAMIEEGIVEVVSDITVTSLETTAGVLQIEIVRNETSGIHEIQVTHDPPVFLDVFDPKDYTEALGLTLADILSPNPLQIVRLGIPHLIVPVTSMRSLEKVQPNWRILENLGASGNYISLIVFTRETYEETSDVNLRTFAPTLGLNEDAVSGSSAASVACYVIRHGFMDPTIPVTSVVVEQGHFVGRPGKVIVEVRGDQSNIKEVKVSGTGVTVLRGTLFI